MNLYQEDKYRGIYGSKRDGEDGYKTKYYDR